MRRTGARFSSSLEGKNFSLGVIRVDEVKWGGRSATDYFASFCNEERSCHREVDLNKEVGDPKSSYVALLIVAALGRPTTFA